MTHRILTACLLSLALLAAGCGGGDPEQAAAPKAAESTPAPTSTATAAPAPAPAPAKISKDLKTKPEVPKPSGDPPAKLKIDDVVRGKGKRAKAGDQVTVQYVGVSFTTGEQFDASWDRNEPFPFALGTGQVIPGWDKGVAGMRAGGRRELTIPPDLAYGPDGQPPTIQPNETLIFVVDLLKIS